MALIRGVGVCVPLWTSASDAGTWTPRKHRQGACRRQLAIFIPLSYGTKAYFVVGMARDSGTWEYPACLPRATVPRAAQRSEPLGLRLLASAVTLKSVRAVEIMCA